MRQGTAERRFTRAASARAGRASGGGRRERLALASSGEGAGPPRPEDGCARRRRSSGARSRRMVGGLSRARAWTCLGTLAAACLATPPALAFDPADIVARTPESERTLRQVAAEAAARQALEDAEAGTQVVLSVEPELAYGADIEDPARFGAAASVRLELGWQSDPDAEAATAIDLLDARERLRHWRRVEVRDALRLHAKLLRAELALRRAELDRLRAGPAAAGSPTGARAGAVVAARRHALDAMRVDAARLGFTDAPRFAPVRFVLPEPPATSLTRRRLVLELERARLRLDALPFDQLRQLALDATYESRSYGYQIGAALSFERGRPTAGLNGQLGPQEDDQWSIALSARLRLDDGDEADRHAAEERLRRAQAALAEYDARRPEELRRSRQAVADAWALLEAELAAWRADGAGADPATAAACRERIARENAVYGAWLEVVSAAFERLEVVDGSWVVELPRRSAEAPSTRPTNAAFRAPDLPRSAAPALSTAAAPTLWPARPTTCDAVLHATPAGRP